VSTSPSQPRLALSDDTQVEHRLAIPRKCAGVELCVSGAIASVRVLREDGLVLVERDATEDERNQRQVTISLRTADLESWTAFRTLGVFVRNVTVEHPRDDGLAFGAWRPIATVHLVSKRARAVVASAAVASVSLALLWLTAARSAGSRGRLALDLASAAVALLPLVALRPKATARAPLFAWAGVLLALCVSVASWMNTVVSTELVYGNAPPWSVVSTAFKRRRWLASEVRVADDSVVIRGATTPLGPRCSALAPAWWRAFGVRSVVLNQAAPVIDVNAAALDALKAWPGGGVVRKSVHLAG
jgi:hypothetical protein